jgi:hypothetical protein
VVGGIGYPDRLVRATREDQKVDQFRYSCKVPLLRVSAQLGYRLLDPAWPGEYLDVLEQQLDPYAAAVRRKVVDRRERFIGPASLDQELAQDPDEPLRVAAIPLGAGRRTSIASSARPCRAKSSARATTTFGEPSAAKGRIASAASSTRSRLSSQMANRKTACSPPPATRPLRRTSRSATVRPVGRRRS